MATIGSDSGSVTQITVMEVENGKQDELLALMTERARFMSRRPGFVSISLHRSLDGKRIVNYVQWASRDELKAAHQTEGFRKTWPQIGAATEDISPNLYEVVYIEG